MRLMTLALLCLIALLHSALWFGRGSVPHVMELQAKLDEQKLRNDEARARNAQASAEVSDLKEGLEMVEEKARSELGMVKADEILVQVSTPRSGATSGVTPSPQR